MRSPDSPFLQHDNPSIPPLLKQAPFHISLIYAQPNTKTSKRRSRENERQRQSRERDSNNVSIGPKKNLNLQARNAQCTPPPLCLLTWLAYIRPLPLGSFRFFACKLEHAKCSTKITTPSGTRDETETQIIVVVVVVVAHVALRS